MKRFHVHAHVEDLQASIAFYSKLFAAEPARARERLRQVDARRPAHQLRDLDARRQAGRRPPRHPDRRRDEELAELKARAQAADMALLDEGETSCCYARSEKHWVTDPQGIAWEHFHTLGRHPGVQRAAGAEADAGIGLLRAAGAARQADRHRRSKPPSSCC